MKTNILIVLTSHSDLGDTGKKTGAWFDEIAAPYYTLKDAGAEVTLASPKGGQVPIDPVSQSDDFQTYFTRRFKDDAEAQSAIAATKKLSDVEMSDFDAILHPGGQGPFWDIVSDPDSIHLVEAAWAQDKVVAALCHGVSALLDAKDENGEPIVRGRNVTGFSDAEEKEYGTDVVVPFLLQTELEKRGANYAQGANWAAFTQQDGRLITGQNPASSEQVARLMLAELQKRSAIVT